MKCVGHTIRRIKRTDKKTIIKLNIDFECSKNKYTSQFKLRIAPYIHADRFIETLIKVNNLIGWEEFILKSYEQIEFQNYILKAEVKEQKRLLVSPT